MSLTKAANDYAYGGKSRIDLHKAQLNANRQLNKSNAQYSIDRAAAKRDYKIAKGKNEARANKKYDKAVAKSKRAEESANQAYVNQMYRSNPIVTRTLAKSGNISVKSLNKARINAGIDAVDLLVKAGSAYSKRR